MTSDEKRREVAARLRADHRQDHESQVTFIARMVTGKDRVTVVDVLRLPKTLADLIDPTCEMTPQGEGFRCSACGTYHDMSGFEEFPWPRCPNCGARVKGSNSMPLGGEGR